MSNLADINPQLENETGCDPIQQIIIPRTADIGGFEVHRALPSAQRRMVGPFIFWDQMGPGEFLTHQGVDVRPHPHIGLSTVTYLFSGTLDHKDSLGSDQRITAGDVNLMTAGRGISHSERTGADIREAPSELFGIQSWLALPKHSEESAPAFEHIGRQNLPIIEEKGMKARLIMGGFGGKKSPVTTLTDTLYVDITLDPGSTLEIPADSEERALYPVMGRIEIAGIAYDPHQLLILHPKDTVTLKALDPVRIMLMGGEVMDAKRYIWWNFVSSSRERIEQAKEDWRNGKFAAVPGDNEFIPLPE